MESHFYFNMCLCIYEKVPQQSGEKSQWGFHGHWTLITLASAPSDSSSLCPCSGSHGLLISTWLLTLLPFLESLPPLRILGFFNFGSQHFAGTWSIIELLWHVLPTGSAVQHNILQKKNSLHLRLQFTKDYTVPYMVNYVAEVSSAQSSTLGILSHRTKSINI